ncbi:hypothetical protein B0T10DRAFT_257324, partial [Thelonectria olida]
LKAHCLNRLRLRAPEHGIEEVHLQVNENKSGRNASLKGMWFPLLNYPSQAPFHPHTYLPDIATIPPYHLDPPPMPKTQRNTTKMSSSTTLAAPLRTENPTFDFLKSYYGLRLDNLPAQCEKFLSDAKIREMIDAPYVQTDASMERAAERLTKFLDLCNEYLTWKHWRQESSPAWEVICRTVPRRLDVEVDLHTVIGFTHTLMYIRYKHWAPRRWAERPCSTLVCSIDVVFFNVILWSFDNPGELTAPRSWRRRYHIIEAMISMTRDVCVQLEKAGEGPEENVYLPTIIFPDFDITNDRTIDVASRVMQELLKSTPPDDGVIFGPAIIGGWREPENADLEYVRDLVRDSTTRLNQRCTK